MFSLVLSILAFGIAGTLTQFEGVAVSSPPVSWFGLAVRR